MSRMARLACVKQMTGIKTLSNEYGVRIIVRLLRIIPKELVQTAKIIKISP